MKTITEKQILKEIIKVINSYDGIFTDKDMMLIDGIYRVFNDAEFESKHPRKKDGKFAKKGEQEPSQAYIDILDKIRQSNDKNISPQGLLKDMLSMNLKT